MSGPVTVAHDEGFSTLTPQTAWAQVFFYYNSEKLLKTFNYLGPAAGPRPLPPIRPGVGGAGQQQGGAAGIAGRPPARAAPGRPAGEPGGL